MSGIATAVALKEARIDFTVLEKADRVGGTWRDNTYPGCGCDVPSSLYSFSFEPNPDWSRTFATQPEILDYVERTARRRGVMEHVRFRTEMLDATWDGDRRRWLVDTTAGRYVAQVLVAAAGPITEPSIPDLPGLDRFTGEVFHSGRWDHDVDLRGRRVAVVGTGASSVQFVPRIRRRAKQVHVFQRTPSWVVPKPDLRLGAAAHALFRRMPAAQRGLRRAIDRGLEGMTYTLHDARLRAQLERVALMQLRVQVRDPQLRASLTPSFRLGCKRLLVSNDWYPALTARNVELIPHALTEVGERHVVGADGTRREADVLIFGTGFDVSHPPIAARIRGHGGRPLAERWAGSPEAYLGLAVSGVPNAFITLGPNILVYTSFVAVAEAQVGYIVDALRRMERDGAEVIEVRREVQDEHNRRVQEALKSTVWNSGGCRSYYLDESGRNFAGWPWSLTNLRRRLAGFDPADYELTPAREAAVMLR
jgi:cation diffusion facilitator CzcD-associated flavoprotein CzcO